MVRYKLRTLLIVLLHLFMLPLFAQDKANFGDALIGEWEIEEWVYKGKVQDFGGKTAGCFVFDSGGVIRIFGDEVREKILADKGVRKLRTNRYTIRGREIDVELTPPIGDGTIVKGICEVKDGIMRLMWPNDAGERPQDFDEAYKNPRMTLYVLKKLK